MQGLGMCWVVPVMCGAGGAPAAAAPAASRPAADEKVERILDTLERRGDTVEDLSCDLTLEIEDRRVFEKTTKEGTLRFRRERPNALFRVDFRRLIEGDGTVKLRKEWHIFDGHWYVEARAFTKTVIQREIVRAGESVDPFELGKGPFPLPFGQKKADILRKFTVALVPPADGDPSDSDHLRCIPRPGSGLADDYKEVDFYVSRDKELPVRVVSQQKKERKTLTVNFKRIETNTGLAKSRMSKAFPKSWTRQIERLPPPQQVGGR